jgi:hypothetical protein
MNNDSIPTNVGDLTGKRYDKLTVTRFLYSERIWHPDEKKRHTNTYWECACDCGNIVKTMTRYLNSGSVRSCGCLYEENRPKQKPESAFNELYNRYICRAKNKHLEFSISKEFFKKLTKENCAYCGEEPKQVQNGDRIYPYIYNSIDRVDNTQGYIEGNCVPCCGVCNHMKNTLSKEDFLQHIQKIVKHTNW